MATRKRGERVIRKSRVVTFRMDQGTWDFMRRLVPYTRYKKASPFIREGIELLLRREGACRRAALSGTAPVGGPGPSLRRQPSGANSTLRSNRQRPAMPSRGPERPQTKPMREIGLVKRTRNGRPNPLRASGGYRPRR